MKWNYRGWIKTVAGFVVVLNLAGAASASGKEIVDTAISTGSFKTLVAAVLEATMRGSGPLTVFAPTDAAFARLPQGTVQELRKPENKAKLQAILT